MKAKRLRDTSVESRNRPALPDYSPTIEVSLPTGSDWLSQSAGFGLLHDARGKLVAFRRNDRRIKETGPLCALVQ